MDMYETETGNPAPTVLPMLYGKWRHRDQPKHFFVLAFLAGPDMTQCYVFTWFMLK